MFCRSLHEATVQQVESEWQRPEWDEQFTLTDKSLCIIGVGSLGTHIAKLAKRLDLSVVGVRRSNEPVNPVDNLYQPDGLLEAISGVDFVVLSVPLTDRTKYLIGTNELEAMKDDAYLINVARGSVVNEQELIWALEDDMIAGAAMDVFEEEPLRDDSPLWSMNNVIVTPHLAGGYNEYYKGVGEIFLRNYERLVNNEPIINRIC